MLIYLCRDCLPISLVLHSRYMVSYTLITDYKPILNVFIIYKSFQTYWQGERTESPEAASSIEAVATGGKEGI